VSEQRISDEAVRTKTGRSWKEWTSLLDGWGAAGKGHKTTARFLSEEHGLPGWWAQTVTVRYEQEKGLRVVGQKKGGFELSVQRTIAAPVARAWEAFTSPDVLSTWFTTKADVDLAVGGSYSNADGDRGQFKRIDPKKLLRFTWDNPGHCPGTMVEVTFDTKAAEKSVVRLTHSRLADQKAREEMKEGWIWAMDNGKRYLETGEVMPFEAWRARREKPG
jgi:uncharacterized protein YndB with AHSA1/START domain